MDKIDQHQAEWREFRTRQAAGLVPKPAASRRPTSRAVAKQVKGTTPDLMLVKLEADLHRLSLQPSREARTKVQGELLQSPLYSEYLAKVLAGQRLRGEDPVLIYGMIWAFNTQALALALALAQVAIKRGLAMPKDFKATVEIFICREVAYWSLAQQKAGNSPQPYLDQVFNQSRQWAKPDQIEARLLKAKGQDIQQVNPNEALTLYKRAQTLDADCGVSHLIKRVQKQLQG